jgi:hypothetical protein
MLRALVSASRPEHHERTANCEPHPDSAAPFFTIAAVPLPFRRGRCSNVVNLQVRSTSVPIADRVRLMMRSLSQCPCVFRLSAAFGRR